MPDMVQMALRVRRNWLSIAALGVAVALVACGRGPVIDPLDVGDPERGREIFETGG